MSMRERLSLRVVALEELIKPNQGERFKDRRAWEALRHSE